MPGPVPEYCINFSDKIYAIFGYNNKGLKVPKIDTLLNEVIVKGASDLHLTSNSVPIIRLKGKIIKLNYDILKSEDILVLIKEIIPDFYLQEFKTTKDSDFAYSMKNSGRFRVNIFNDTEGVGAVFRHIPDTIPSFEEIDLNKNLQRICELSKGLILVTGPTGSGKTTTLATMINYIAKIRNYHIITIEDPIEFVYNSNRSLIHQRELNLHTKSYSNALRTALRQDPDVILIGEMRDLETTKLAIEASETGHLVFATLHTNTAYSTISRIINQFNEDEQELIRVMLADNLRGVICQNLLRCENEKGRIAAREVWLHTVAGANIIRENKLHLIPSLLEGNRAIGMTSLNHSLIELIIQKTISVETAMEDTTEPIDLIERLAKLGIKQEDK